MNGDGKESMNWGQEEPLWLKKLTTPLNYVWYEH